MEEKAKSEIMEKEFNLTYLLSTVRRYLAVIITIISIACLLAIILTMPAFYPPEYMSNTIIYPTNPERFDLDNLFADDPLIYLYGDSKGVERLENIANSEALKLSVIDSLDLWEAYGIDKENGSSPKYYVLLNYNTNVSAVRVAGNGLEIVAFDKDPVRAANIVNLVVDQIDAISRKMLTQNRLGVLETLKLGEQQLSEQVEIYTDSIRRVRRDYNVYHIERQTEALLKEVVTLQNQLVGARSNGSTARVRQLENQMKALTQQGDGSVINLEQFREGLDKVIQLQVIHEELTRELKNMRSKISNMERMANVDFRTILITEEALPADRKSKPVRGIILLATGLVALVVSLGGVVLIDILLPRLKKNDK